MTIKYLKSLFILLSFAIVLACSGDETKNSLRIDGTSRPSIPINSNEVQIGSQVWMTKNLNVSRYRNGDPIPQVSNSTQWNNITTGAWCYYENNTANGRIYGKLYNWYAVKDPRGLAPMGYHVPSYAEWRTLTTFLGMEVYAGGKMKENGVTHWLSPNIGATNSSGFTGLPGGYRYSPGTFHDMGTDGYWWSSSANSEANAWILSLNFTYVDAFIYLTDEDLGLSVRCLRD